MHEPLFILSNEDWSLHRKGELDQERHKRKVKEAIKRNLADLVSEESIIMSQGDKVVKVPIRGLDEPKFRYDYNDNQPRVGQGSGGTKVGDTIGKAAQDGQAAGPGKGKQVGDQAGVDYYEAEITIDELAELVYEDLQLPRLKPKNSQDLTVDDIRFNDVRRKGMMGNVDKHRTILESLKRQSLSGSSSALGAIHNEDLRFKTWEDIRKPQSSAVVLAMMDTSGSMGTFEKYMARSFFFWMVRFLRTKYDHVKIRFLAHHTEAMEVDENSFFNKGESGGTRCSSVYQLALQLIEQNYPQDHYNVYAFHFSDGDNLDSDNAQTVKLALEMLQRINHLGYGEIHQYSSPARKLWNEMSAISHQSYSSSILQEKADIYRTLKAFFGSSMAI